MPNKPRAPLTAYLIPSIADIIFISILFIIAMITGGRLLGDGDTGYHIRAGELILDTLHLPTSDPFSFISPALTWTVHEWLAEVIMALLHRLGGLTAVVVFFAILITTTYSIFLRLMKSQGHGVLASAAITMLLFTIAQMHWLARPHTFSMLIMAGWYALLDNFQYRQRDQLWLLPILILLWANIHGGCIVGFILLGIFMLGDCLHEYFSSGRLCSCRTRKYGFIGLACLLAALINPYSYKIFLFPFKLISDTYMMGHVEEFLPPNLHEPIIKFMLLAMIASLAALKRKLTAIDLLLLIFFTNMALTSVRYVPLFALFVLPVMFKGITLPAHPLLGKIFSFFARREASIAATDQLARGILWPVLSTLAILFLACSGRITFALDPKTKPLAAIEFITKNQIKGKVFNHDEFGDLLIYQTSGQCKVFIDGRLDMYGSKQLAEYSKLINFDQGWEAIMAKYGMSWIFYPSNSPFSRYLATQPAWKLVYSDPVASIFVHDIPLHSTLIAQYPQVKLAEPLTKGKDL